MGHIFRHLLSLTLQCNFFEWRKRSSFFRRGKLEESEADVTLRGRLAAPRGCSSLESYHQDKRCQFSDLRKNGRRLERTLSSWLSGDAPRSSFSAIPQWRTSAVSRAPEKSTSAAVRTALDPFKLPLLARQTFKLTL